MDERPDDPATAPAAETSERAGGAASAGGAYRVLARKYRPQSFDALIGQAPMVTTLSNAFESGRIAQAYMLTGVRGVGKTTTARILARALNYEAPGIDRPTIRMPVLGRHCREIMEGRHIDVSEMDAASHTGISDVREIIEAARYKPALARFKVWIVDEVHMLSTAAFNGLLKTLEEPPEHVKFVFATTEIRKVPVTVLSRCQRFDLRRVEADVLVAHLAKVAEAESIEVEAEALRLVARAAEGSVRDALSILDQAIAHGGGRVEAEAVRTMLGLADRSRVLDLFEHVMRGDAAAAVAELGGQYAVGADPAVVLADLAEVVHRVTRLKVAPDATADAAASEEERRRGRDAAAALSLRVLSRAWQMLLKGIEEVRAAPRPLAAADMVLVRLCYAADLPTPDEALRALKGQAGGATAMARSAPSLAPGPGGPRPSSGGQAAVPAGLRPSDDAGAGAPRAVVAAPRFAVRDRAVALDQPAVPVRAEAAVPQPAAGPASFADIVALAAAKRDVKLKHALETHVRPVSVEPGRLVVETTSDAAPELVGDLSRKLGEWTGARWMVVVARDGGGETIAESRVAARHRLEADARADPLVAAVVAKFPGAQIVDIRVRDETVAPGETTADLAAADFGPFDLIEPPLELDDDEP